MNDIPKSCEQVVYRDNGRTRGNCARRASYEHGGKWYCTQHYPPHAARKREQKEAFWAEQSDRAMRAIEGRERATQAVMDYLTERHKAGDAQASDVLLQIARYGLDRDAG